VEGKTRRGSVRRWKVVSGLLAVIAVTGATTGAFRNPVVTRVEQSSIASAGEAVTEADLNVGVRARIENNYMIVTIPDDRKWSQDVEVYVAILRGPSGVPEAKLKITPLFEEKDGTWRMPLGRLPDVYQMDGQRVGFVAGLRDPEKVGEEQWAHGFPRNAQGKTAYAVMKVR